MKHYNHFLIPDSNFAPLLTIFEENPKKINNKK